LIGRRTLAEYGQQFDKAGGHVNYGAGTFHTHDRWGKSALAMTSRVERIRYATIGGRTTAWVPAVQR